MVAWNKGQMEDWLRQHGLRYDDMYDPKGNVEVEQALLRYVVSYYSYAKGKTVDLVGVGRTDP